MIVIWFSLLTGCSSKERINDRIWIFDIEEIMLDSLKASFSGDFNQHIYYFEKHNDNRWMINVPDSIYYGYQYLTLFAYQQDKGWCEILLVDSPKFVKYNITNILFFTDNNYVFVEAKPILEQKDNDNILVLTSTCSDEEYVNGKKWQPFLLR
jgi:hypothetical protein